MITQIFLKRGKEESLKRHHRWVFSGAIESIRSLGGEVREGDIVDVYDKKGDFVACGHYQIGSITVRVLSFEREEIDDAWWQARIGEAYAVRKAEGIADSKSTTCYRLVHGEGDNLSGLVVDIYARTAVVQCHSVGMYRSRGAIAAALKAVFGDKLDAVYDKSSQTVPYKANLGAIDGYLYGSHAGAEVVLENDLKFSVDWQSGQKTGFLHRPAVQ